MLKGDHQRPALDRWPALGARSRMMPLSLGSRIIYIYLAFAYLIPAVAITTTAFTSYFYKSPPMTMVSFVYGAITIAAVMVAATRRTWGQGWAGRVAIPEIPYFPQLAVISGLIAICGIGYLEGLSRWRYESTGLSENLSATALVYVIAPVLLEFMLFLEIFFVSEAAQKSLHRRFMMLLLALGLALVASGIGPFLTVIMALMFVFFPGQVRLLIFRERNADTSRALPAALGLIPMGAAVAVSIVIALILGEQVKTGVDSTTITQYYGNATVTDFFRYLIDRFSTAWYSLTVALDEYATVEWTRVAQNLWAPVGNFLFRLDTLIGAPFGFQRPFSGSLMRINYETINFYPVNEREGTSPGLIAGFILALPIPFSIATVAGYALVLRKLFNYLSAGMTGTPTMIGAVLAMYFSFQLFQSPIDYFLVFDPGFATFVLFAGLALVIRSQCKMVKINVTA